MGDCDVPPVRRGGRRAAPRLPQPVLHTWGSWAERGACVGTDTGLFFPNGFSQKMSDARVARAKEFCECCTVAEQCLRWALAANEQGVWGGMTGPERARLQEAEQAAEQNPQQTAQAARRDDGRGRVGADAIESPESAQKGHQGRGGRA